RGPLPTLPARRMSGASMSPKRSATEGRRRAIERLRGRCGRRIGCDMNELSSVLTQPATIFDLPTPALILDQRKLQSNADRMQARVRKLGVTLRPHVKTSKSIDVLRILSSGAEVPITVSTLAEARYFFGQGVRDILYA